MVVPPDTTAHRRRVRIDRVIHPSAMKSGFLSTMVPSKVTGMGYMKTFLPAEIFPIDPFTLLCYGKGSIKRIVQGRRTGLSGVLWKSSEAEFMQ